MHHDNTTELLIYSLFVDRAHAAMARMGQQLLLCIARKELGNSFPPLCGVTSHKNNLGGDRDCNCFKPSSYSCIIYWFRAVIGRTKTAVHSLAILIIWSVSKERNKRIFIWQEISIQALVGRSRMK